MPMPIPHWSQKATLEEALPGWLRRVGVAENALVVKCIHDFHAEAQVLLGGPVAFAIDGKAGSQEQGQPPLLCIDVMGPEDLTEQQKEVLSSAFKRSIAERFPLGITAALEFTFNILEDEGGEERIGVLGLMAAGDQFLSDRLRDISAGTAQKLLKQLRRRAPSRANP